MEESKLYRLEEMSDAIQESILNIDKIALQQNDLIKVLSESDKHEEFEEFISDCKEQTKKLYKQKDELIDKKQNLDIVISKAKINSELEDILNSFMNAIGMFK